MSRRFWLLSGCLVLLLSGCGGRHEEQRPEKENPEVPSPFPVAPALQSSPKAKVDPPQKAARFPVFHDVHSEAKLEHVYVNGERGRCHLFETTGGGAGWLDFDNDGHWDLYVNQGGDATLEANEKQPLDQLFRNRGDGTFEDVTQKTRLVEFYFSQGVAIGDYDNDGFDDVYVTNLGRNTLFHNQGDGTFLDVTQKAGVGDTRWSSSAAWADLDGDGDLDLYVVNYCVDDPKNPAECRGAKGALSICHPRNVDPWPDECYINNGDGTFSAEAKKRGLVDDSGRGLGVAVADFNNDGLPDIFVTNDTTANFLFINQGNGMFEERAMLEGCAVDANGSFMANMGIGVYDFDRNGFLDVYITHFDKESDTLYRNYGREGFHDESARFGIVGPTMDRLSWGVVMNDFDQDGKPDMFVTSGHIENAPGYPYYRMRPLLFNMEGDRFVDRTNEAGEFFQHKRVGRGVAACDYDNDGDLDLAVVHENSPVALLRNDSQRGHWLKFQMRGRQSNRRGIGCRVAVKSGETTTMQELCGGTSYAVTHQPALVFGLGEWKSPCSVTVRWPSGRVQALENVAVDQAIILDEAKAERKTPPTSDDGKAVRPVNTRRF